MNLPYGAVNLPAWMNCGAYHFFFYFFAHYSSTILIIMSVEKCFVLYFPFKAKIVCTLQIARWASLISAVLLIAFEAQFFFIFESYDINGIEICVYSNEEYGSVMETMKSVVYSYVPFAIMGLTSFAIVIKFIMLKRNSGHESTNLAVNKSATRGTVTVFLLSITFITLTGPICIYGVITDKDVALVSAVFLILQYMNHAVNAVLFSWIQI